MPTHPGESDGGEALLEAKRRLRLRIGRARESLMRPVVEAAGDALVGHWSGQPDLSACRRVFLYAALESELPTRPLFEHLRRRGTDVFFPRCRGRVLEFGQVADWSALRPGHFGILEPVSSTPVAHITEDDWVVVPGVAFDARGNRLGRGKGWYDRTLADLSPERLIGAGFALQVVATVPANARDRRVGAILTERGFTWASRTE